MAESVEDFLFENVGSPVEEKEIKLERFKSPFKIKSLTADEVSDLRKQATKRVLNRKTHKYEQETNENQFQDLVVAEAVVSPNLNNEKLQTSWGCIAKPEEVLKKMLKVGEYTELSQAIMDLSGLNDDDSSEDLVEEAKN